MYIFAEYNVRMNFIAYYRYIVFKAYTGYFFQL